MFEWTQCSPLALHTKTPHSRVDVSIFWRAGCSFSWIFLHIHKCTLVAVPYVQSLGWLSDSWVISFVPPFFGHLTLLSSSVWWCGEGRVQTDLSSPLVDDLLVCPASLWFLVSPWVSVFIRAYLRVAGYLLAFSGSQWAVDIDIWALLVCLFSCPAVCPSIGSWLPVLHICLASLRCHLLSLFLLCDFFLSS